MYVGQSAEYTGKNTAGTTTVTKGRWEIVAMTWDYDVGAYYVTIDCWGTRIDGSYTAQQCKVTLNTYNSSGTQTGTDYSTAKSVSGSTSPNLTSTSSSCYLKRFYIYINVDNSGYSTDAVTANLQWTNGSNWYYASSSICTVGTYIGENLSVPVYGWTCWWDDGISSISGNHQNSYPEGTECYATATVKSGYGFWGWCWDQAGTSIYSTSKSISFYKSASETHLYALSSVSYTYNLNYTGATGAPASTTAPYGGGAITSTSPTRTGYNFTGWNTKADGSGVEYGPGAAFYTTTASNTLYAQWAVKTYTIQYNANGGSGTMSSQTKTHGTALTLRTNTFTRASVANDDTTGSFTITGNGNGGYFGTTSTTTTTLAGKSTTKSGTNYSFKEYNTAANGSGTSYASGASYTTNASATMYAQWNSSAYSNTTYSNNTLSLLTKPTGRISDYSTGYKVTFDENGGSTVSDLTSQILNTYSFVGWNTSQTATTALAETTSYTSAKTVYAIWKKTSTNQSITLPTPTRTNYTFLGWYSGSTKIGNGGASYTPTAAITLTASWQQDTWTVSYNANGGSGAPSGQTKYRDQTLTLSTTKPTKTGTASKTATTNIVLTANANGGYFDSTSTATSTQTGYKYTWTTPVYTFSNWNTAQNGTGTSYNSGGSYTANAAATLYAQYTESSSTSYTYENNLVSTLPQPSRANTTHNGYLVTFDANGGSCDVTQRYAINTRSYSFNGWATTSTATSANAAYSYTASRTLYAYWTYDETKGSLTLPTPEARTDYTFIGWSTDKNASTGTTGSYTPTGATTLYAIWRQDAWPVIYNTTLGNTDTLPASTKKLRGQTLYLSSTGPTREDTVTRIASNQTATLDANGGYFSDTQEGSRNITVYRTRVVTTSYTFAGWNTAEDGSGAVYAAGAAYTTNASLTLWAQWTSSTKTVYEYSTDNNVSNFPTPVRDNEAPVTYTVSFVSEGITVPSQRAPKVRTYTFKGWSQDYEATSGVTSGQFSNNNAWYAIWSSTETVTPITLPIPTRNTYEFLGWGTTAEEANIGTGTYTPTRSISLYAVWKKLFSVIRYNNAGAQVKCKVFYNNNGTPVLCNVFYNNNGTKVQI